MLDLIDECGQDLAALGYETVDLGRFNATSSKLFVDTTAKANKLGFEKGHYFILNAPKLSYFLKEHENLLAKEIEMRLRFLFKENNIKKKDKILLVGIGNPKILADSFGIRAVEKISFLPFKKSNRIFKIMPNVFNSTGFNAYDIIHLLVGAFDIDAVVIFDSLATENIARLGTSIQFNDAGLTPGSALNNFGLAINRSTLHVPCVSVGAVMMTLCKEKRDLILTEKDAEEKIEFFSSVVAKVFDAIL